MIQKLIVVFDSIMFKMYVWLYLKRIYLIEVFVFLKYTLHKSIFKFKKENNISVQ